MKRHGAYQRPGALDPWQHNAIVHRRKRYAKVSREFRAASNRMGATFRQLGESAHRAAESLRDVRTALYTLNRSRGTA